jgi:plastocyanin
MRLRRQLRHGALSLALVALVLAAWGGTLPTKTKPTPKVPAGPVVVVLKHIEFIPEVVKIHPGQTVEWKWEDSPVAHNVSFKRFQSPLKAKGTWSHKFTTKGTYHYQCTIHVGMVGTIIVK